MGPDALAPIRAPIVYGVGTNLMAINANGTGATALTAFPANVWARDPVWSPDGQALAYTLVHPRTDEDGDTVATGMICGIDRRTGTGRVLAPDTHGVESRSEATWTKDGQAFLLVQQREPGTSGQQAGSSTITIAQYDLARGTTQPLVEDVGTPALSPDGQALVCVHEGHHGMGKMLMRAHATGQNAEPLVTSQPAFHEMTAPTWSPNSRYLVFAASGGPPDSTAHHAATASTSSNQVGLWMVDRDEQGLRRLTTKGLDTPRVAWSPNSRQIAYTNSKQEIMLLDVSSGREHRLTDEANYGGITWAHRSTLTMPEQRNFPKFHAE